MNTKKKFINALIGIYNLEIIKYFTKFLEGEQAVLFALYISTDNTPSKISERLGITKSRMSNIITSLISKNMIETTKDAQDRRKVILKLKAAGVKFIQEKEKEVLIIFDTYYLLMGEEKIAALTKLLDDTKRIIKEIDNND